jgi:ABC-type uncharacterized transport system permease subunit
MRYWNFDKAATRIRYKWEGFKSSNRLRNILASAAAVAAGLIVCLIILIATHPSAAFQAFGRILTGGRTGGAAGRGNVLYLAAPVILTGLSVGFAKRAGQFNAGTPGQFIAGACAAVYVAAQAHFIPLPVRCFICGGAGRRAVGLDPGAFESLPKNGYIHYDDADEFRRALRRQLADYICARRPDRGP